MTEFSKELTCGRSFDFGPREHALLFSSIVRAILSSYPKDAPTIIESAVELYALERGRRMRARALAAGDGITMGSYRAYCEWMAPVGTLSSEIVQRSPVLITRTAVCPWYEAWKSAGRLVEGRFYCQYVDEYLVRGFNEDLYLGLTNVHSEGSRGTCEFSWYGVDYTIQSEAEYTEMRMRVLRTGIKSWTYHMKHLISAFKRTLNLKELNSISVLTEAQSDFASIVSEEAACIFDMEFNF